MPNEYLYWADEHTSPDENQAEFIDLYSHITAQKL